MKRSMLRKTVIPIPPARNTYRWFVSSGSKKLPFGCSTSTSAPIGSSTSERLKAESRRRVQKPSLPRSFGDVTTEKWRRAPRSSSYGGPRSVTKKYWPGVNSTSSPNRSKTTSSVPFATSRFSATRARNLGPANFEGGQQHEHDRRDGKQSMQRHHRDREVLLGWNAGRCDLAAAGSGLPALEPDREHRPAEQGHDCEDREGDPGECVLVVDQVDDPDDETSCGKQEVAQDQRRPDPVARLLLLAHSASHHPDRKQHEAAARRDHPGDERSPLHHASLVRIHERSSRSRTTVFIPRG